MKKLMKFGTRVVSPKHVSQTTGPDAHTKSGGPEMVSNLMTGAEKEPVERKSIIFHDLVQ
ncbi:hypothetical protein Ciccas_012931 [Cichlidogyrus casuarinus]|uniref:Uncharacterized protein n=1 Tax=Cichlidogyrus casuarinus TaxID=1844966 RepID=A0ABD2PM06_9PLAT